jgi:aldehyde:ferredoxin oxidoreductase
MAALSYRILEIDLSTGETHTIEYGEEILGRYFGGSGLAVFILFNRFNPSVEAFHPDSPRVFMTGLFTGERPCPAAAAPPSAPNPPLSTGGKRTPAGTLGRS